MHAWMEAGQNPSLFPMSSAFHPFSSTHLCPMLHAVKPSLLPSPPKGQATYPINVVRLPKLLRLGQDLLAHPVVDAEAGAVLKLGDLHIPIGWGGWVSQARGRASPMTCCCCRRCFLFLRTCPAPSNGAWTAPPPWPRLVTSMASCCGCGKEEKCEWCGGGHCQRGELCKARGVARSSATSNARRRQQQEAAFRPPCLFLISHYRCPTPIPHTGDKHQPSRYALARRQPPGTLCLVLLQALFTSKKATSPPTPSLFTLHRHSHSPSKATPPEVQSILPRPIPHRPCLVHVGPRLGHPSKTRHKNPAGCSSPSF